MTNQTEPKQSLEILTKMNRDLRKASSNLSANEARFLVSTYYSMQADRIKTTNQLRSLEGETNQSHETLQWFADQSTFLENQIKTSLDVYSINHPVGAWMRSQKGVGPVIAAGLLAHIDIHKAKTPGHIWSFAGLNPQAKWEKGQKRPWNADLKVLCWKLGESFIKVSNREGAFYGKLYKERKRAEVSKNFQGAYADTAAQILASKNFSKSTEAYKWYSGDWVNHAALVNKADEMAQEFELDNITLLPRLPPAHLNARARRYVVKIFLAHLWEVWYEIEIGPKPPRPYAEAILGHAHIIEVPNKPESKS